MDTSLVLILILAFAFATNYVEVKLLGERLILFAGIEFLVLGVVVGPLVLDILDETKLDDLRPLLSVITGFLGFLFGLPSGERVQRLHRGAWRFAAAHVVVTGLLVAGVMWLALAYLPAFEDSQPVHLAVAAAILGLGAAVCSAEAILSGIATSRALGNVSSLLPAAASAGRILVIGLVGLVACFEHLESAVFGEIGLGWLDWCALSVGTGMAAGLIFHVFAGTEEDEEKLFVATIGVVALASGVAHALEVSPLFVSLVAGLTISAISPTAPRLATAVDRLGRPFKAVLLLIAGALWTTIPALLWAVVLVYVVWRVVAVRLSAAAAAFVSRNTTRLDPDLPGLGNALLSQGPLAAAIAVDYAMIHAMGTEDAVGALVVTALLVTAVVNELWASWALRRVLQNAGETGRTASRRDQLREEEEAAPLDAAEPPPEEGAA